jgi:hypothetical protein
VIYALHKSKSDAKKLVDTEMYYDAAKAVDNSFTILDELAGRHNRRPRPVF